MAIKDAVVVLPFFFLLLSLFMVATQTDLNYSDSSHADYGMRQGVNAGISECIETIDRRSSRDESLLALRSH